MLSPAENAGTHTRKHTHSDYLIYLDLTTSPTSPLPPPPLPPLPEFTSRHLKVETVHVIVRLYSKYLKYGGCHTYPALCPIFHFTFHFFFFFFLRQHTPGARLVLGLPGIPRGVPWSPLQSTTRSLIYLLSIGRN